MDGSVKERVLASARRRGWTVTFLLGAHHLGLLAAQLCMATSNSLIRSIASRIAKFDDWYFDFRFGTDTGGKAPVTEYEVVGENQAHGTGFQSSRPTPFRKVIESLHCPANSVFVDIGSGKGRMLLLASQMGFKRVIGIEFIPSLCVVAERNVTIFRTKRPHIAPIEIHAMDAATYRFTGDENVFYFSNPFDGVLMKRLLQNIASSLEAQPRIVWLVYMNPREHKTVVETGLFREIAHHLFAGGGRDFKVYICEPERTREGLNKSTDHAA